MSDQEIALYSYCKSSCSWRVRIALNLKSIAYKYIPVHLVKDGGQQYAKEFMEKNPTAQVPVLLIDGLQLFESVAIIEYLEETRSEPSLLPKDPATRAIVRSIVEMINAGIQPKQNLSVQNYLAKEFADDSAKPVWSGYWNTRGLEAVEKTLIKTAGTYCVGDQVTLADVFLVPQAASALRFNVNLDQFPTIKRIIATLDKLPAFIDAHPKAQPDFVAT